MWNFVIQLSMTLHGIKVLLKFLARAAVGVIVRNMLFQHTPMGRSRLLLGGLFKKKKHPDIII